GVQHFSNLISDRTAGGRHRCGLEGQRASDPVGISGVERVEQLGRLEVGAGDEIDEAEADRCAPACVYASQLRLRYFGGRSFDVFQPAEAKLHAPEQQLREGASWSAGQLETDRFEDSAHYVDAAVEMPAEEQLFGRLTPEL